MVTLTLELPDNLAQQLREKQVAEQEVRAVALAALEIWLAQKEQPEVVETDQDGRFSKSAVPFVQRLIRQNQELFEILAQR